MSAKTLPILITILGLPLLAACERNKEASMPPPPPQSTASSAPAPEKAENPPPPASSQPPAAAPAPEAPAGAQGSQQKTQ